VMKFGLDGPLEGLMPVTEFGDMRLQSHVLPTFRWGG
jgi:hypothetical protein